MFVATITTAAEVFKVKVEPGRQTVHPLSELYEEGNFTDERVPKDLIVVCSPEGTVSVMSQRPEPPNDGTPCQKHVEIETVDGYILVVPSSDKDQPFVHWRQNWVRIECNSIGHAQYVIDLLEEDRIEKVTENTKILRV